MKSPHSKQKGFTLIETLVAISILMLSITGPMVFASQGLKASVYARDQVTAFYLAQDAIETIRHIRDNTAILIQQGSAVPWDTSFSECYPDAPGVPKKCKIDTTIAIDPSASLPADLMARCNNDEECRLNQNNVVYAYGHHVTDTDWVPSKYIRSFSIEKIDAKEITISVEIKWRSGLINRSFIARENMLNIYGEI